MRKDILNKNNIYYEYAEYYYSKGLIPIPLTKNDKVTLVDRFKILNNIDNIDLNYIKDLKNRYKDSNIGILCYFKDDYQLLTFDFDKIEVIEIYLKNIKIHG